MSQFEGGQTAGLNAVTREGHANDGFKALRPNACGHSALSKLPRNILRVFEGGQTAGLKARTREGHGRKRQASKL